MDGALSALPLAGVAADDPTGVLLTSSDTEAYVLGTCVDTDCDSEISLYMIGADSSLNPRVSTTLTGSHIRPVDLVLNSSGSRAYLLTNFTTVDTNSARLFQYTIDSTGALESQGELDVASGAVAATLKGNDLYVLTSDALALVPDGSGGHLVHLSVTGGALSQVDSTRISGFSPTAMASVTQ